MLIDPSNSIKSILLELYSETLVQLCRRENGSTVHLIHFQVQQERKIHASSSLSNTLRIM